MKKWICMALLCVFVCALCPAALAIYQAGNSGGYPSAYITGGEIEIVIDDGGKKTVLATLPWTEEAQAKRFRVVIPSGVSDESSLSYSTNKLNFEFNKEETNAYVDSCYSGRTSSWDYVDDPISVMRNKATEMMYTLVDDSEGSGIPTYNIGEDYIVSNADRCRFYIIKAQSNSGYTYTGDVDFYFPESMRLNYVLSSGPEIEGSLYNAAQDVLYDVVYNKDTDKELKLVFKGMAEYADQAPVIKLEDEKIDKKHYMLEAAGDDLIVTFAEELMKSLTQSKEAGYHKFSIEFEKASSAVSRSGWDLLFRRALAEHSKAGCISVVLVNVTEKTPENAAAADLPSTGDRENLMLWAGMLMLSAASMTMLFRKKSRA